MWEWTPLSDSAEWPWTSADAAAVAKLDEAVNAAGLVEKKTREEFLLESSEDFRLEKRQEFLLDDAADTAAAELGSGLAGVQDESFALLSFYLRQKITEKEYGGVKMNVGDEMQQLAAAQYLPYVTTFVERDDMDESWSDGGVVTHAPSSPSSVASSSVASVGPSHQGLGSTEKSKKTKFIANAWYNKYTRVWPPPEHLDPVMLALHFDGDMPKAYSAEAKQFYEVGSVNK